MDDDPLWQETGLPHAESEAGRESQPTSDLEVLREAVRARDRAIAVVAHDLRNPISVVLQTSSILLRTLSDPRDRRLVQRILDVSTRAKDLVDDLLDVASIEQGSFSIVRRRVDLEAILRGVASSQRALATRESLVISLDVTFDQAYVEADERRIHEVFENLIENALKFTPPGGSITLGADVEPSGDALLWVRDTGSGIPEAELSQVFDRFAQARTANRKGTGLGLGICKAIVEGHGGRIWVESTVGRGTTVYFTLPALRTLPPVEARSFPPANVLLVHDASENLAVLDTILQRPDYRIFRARSAGEALRIARSEPLAVALVDLAMPGRGGLEVAGELRASDGCRDVPILFLTSLGNDPREIQRAYEAGGADYLVKPFDPGIVRSKVLAFVKLGGRRA